MKKVTSTLQEIRKFFFAFYFIQFKNGRFFVIERYFIFWVLATLIAALRMAYEGKNAINSLNASDVLYLPLILMVFYSIWLQFFAPNLSIMQIPQKHWRTRLSFLRAKKKRIELSIREEDLNFDLSNRWKGTYGIQFENSKTIKANKFLPWFWIALLLISIFLFLF